MPNQRRVRSSIALLVTAAVSLGALQAATSPAAANPQQRWPSWFTPLTPDLTTPVPVTAAPAAAVVIPMLPAGAAVSAPPLPVGNHSLNLPASPAAAGTTGRLQTTSAALGGTAATAVGGWIAVAGSAAMAIAPALPAGTVKSAPAASVQVTVAVLDDRKAAAYGTSGVAFTLEQSGPASPIAVRVSRAVLNARFGADFAERAHWTQTPADGSSPARPVAFSNDAAHDTVVLTPIVGTAPTVVSATSGATSSTGNFAASPLSPASSWNVSAQTGDFTWSYPMAAPPPAAGPTPSVALNYDSQSVDGETGSSNNQPSIVGDGWSLAGSGFIERSYVPCAQDKNSATKHTDSGDLCWSSDNATMSFAGHSGPLVKDTITGKWRLRDDDGSLIEHLTGTDNGDLGTAGIDGTGEYWKLTTTDGTQYFFGVDKVPGYQAGDDLTNSTWTVPVFGNDSDEPCHTTSFADSACTQAWRWNLAYVVDTDSNAEKFTYHPETNNYAKYKVTNPATSYIRGGTLERIDYGLRSNKLHVRAAATDQVIFTNTDRCAPGYNCATAAKDHDSWPDVPWDQNCTAATCAASLNSPTFWTSKQLGVVTTQYRTAAPTAQSPDPYTPVDTWTLTHAFPAPGDGTDAALWLGSVGHTATNGLPTSGVLKTSFGVNANTMQNRVNPNTTQSKMPLDKWRITTIVNEMGGATDITYSGQECAASDVASITGTPQSNTKRCYPSWWTPQISPPAANPQEDLFHKYVVTDVVNRPVTAGSDNLTKQVHYVYGAPAWRYDDNPAAVAAYRTWSVYAGYDTVEERDGVGTVSPKTSTSTTYFRGLDGDHGSTLGTVKLHPSDGSTPLDSSWLAGQPLETVTRAGVSGPTLTDTISKPWVSNVTADNGTWQARIVEAGLTTSTASTSTGSRVTSTDNQYDSYGRPISTSDNTPDAGSTCTTTSYGAVDATTWLVDYPAETTVIGKDCSHVDDAVYPSDAISDTQISYDQHAFNAAPTRGNPTTTVLVKGYTGATADTAQPMRTALTAYDAYGRVTDVTDQLSRVTHTAYTQGPGGSTTQTAVTNPLGWTTTTKLDPGRGQTLAVTDQNNHVTTAQYDALGRVTALWRPDHLQSAYPTSPNVSYDYTVSVSSPSVIATTTLTSSSTQTVYSLYDGLGRIRQTQQQIDTNKLIVTDTAYDDDGRAATISGPYPVATALSKSLQTHTAGVRTVQNTFDGAGRKTAEILRYAADESYRTTYTYTGVDRTDVDIVDPDEATEGPTGGAPTRTVTNSRGKPVTLTQYLGSTPGTGPAETTTYGYDTRGNLTSMTDQAGNPWAWTFDVLGRQTTATDPDSGTTTSSYDDGNRLISSTDARLSKVAYSYDDLDRRTGAYQSSTAGPILASWQYDTLSEGQLTSSTSYVGSTSATPGTPYTMAVTGYDAADRPTGTSVVIPNPTGSPTGTSLIAGTYKDSVSYTRSGAVLQVVEPAAGNLPAEEMTMGYDSVDRLTGMSSAAASYLGGVTYDNLSRPVQFGSSNNLQVLGTFGYYPDTGRLSFSTMQAVVQRNAQVSSDTYDYDDAGDVTSLSSVQNTGAFNAPATTQVSDNQCFSYDQLQSLTAAWTPSSSDCATAPSAATPFGGPAPYWASYTVDPATGNRLTAVQHVTTGSGQTSTDTYEYPPAQAARPHAVKTITHQTGGAVTGTDTSTYDADGNTRTRKNNAQTFNWNVQGRLKSATVGGTTQSNTYDADGNLLLQTDSQTGITLFLGDTELHVTPDGSTVTGTRTYTAPAIGTLADRTSDANSHGAEDGSDTRVHWLHTTQLGTGTASVDDTARTVARHYEDPFGNKRTVSPAGLPWPTTHDFLNAPTNPFTALVHLGARDYDPTTGRFLSVDPVLNPASPQQNNGYSYANNNPATTADPTGLRPEGDSGDIDSGSWGSVDKDHNVPESARAVSRYVNYARSQNYYHAYLKQRSARVAAIAHGADFSVFYNGAVQEQGTAFDGVLGGGSGGYACFGRGACNAALQYLSAHPNDLTRAREIAANYCLDNPYSCQKWADQAEMAQGILALGWFFVGGLDGGAPADGEPAKVDAAPDGEGTDGSDSARAGCGGSFSPDTRVVMADGTERSLSKVKIGDRVKATDTKTGKVKAETVTAVWVNHDVDLMDVVVSSDGKSSVIHATQSHLFWAPIDDSWVAAGDLIPGSTLLTDRGIYASVAGTLKVPGAASMWDLTVANSHDFYVAAISAHVLVHNCDVSKHAAEQMEERGVSMAQVRETLNRLPVSYWQEGQWKSGYYDPRTKIFVAKTIDGTVNTVMNDVSKAYVKRLQVPRP